MTQLLPPDRARKRILTAAIVALCLPFFLLSTGKRAFAAEPVQLDANLCAELDLTWSGQTCTVPPGKSIALAPPHSVLIVPDGVVLANYGSVVVEEGAEVRNKGTIEISMATLVNDGLIENEGIIQSSLAIITNGGTIDNLGTLDIGDDAALDNNHLLTNSSRIHIRAEGYVLNSAQGRIVNLDTIDNEGFLDNGGTIDSQCAGTIAGNPVEGHLINVPGSSECEPTMPGDAAMIFISAGTWGSVDGIQFTDEDILLYDRATETWAKHFDGSDVGLVHNDLKAFHLLDDGSILMSFLAVRWLPGLGWVFPQDVVQFFPTSLGDQTAGSFGLYLDGSEVGLTKRGERIDGLAVSPDGRLVISTMGTALVPGRLHPISARDEDLLVLNSDDGSQLGNTWEIYFDGSLHPLGKQTKDINGIWLDPSSGDLYLTGVTGGDKDGGPSLGQEISICRPSNVSIQACQLVPVWQPSEHRVANSGIDALAMGPPPLTNEEDGLAERNGGRRGAATGKDSPGENGDREEDGLAEDVPVSEYAVEEALSVLFIPIVTGYGY